MSDRVASDLNELFDFGIFNFGIKAFKDGSYFASKIFLSLWVASFIGPDSSMAKEVSEEPVDGFMGMMCFYY